jgi:hypothetical protein
MKIPGLRISAEKVGGLVYFGRMLDKIRLYAKGKLPADYVEKMGAGFDGRCCRYLQVDYRAVVEQVEKGVADEEILAWCFAHGRRLTEEEMEIWNGFMTKRGWRDDASDKLKENKRVRGFADRDDIQTLFDFHQADEEVD